MDGQPAVRVVRPRPLGLNDRIPVFWAGQEPTQELKQIDGGALYRHLVAASTPTGSKKRKRSHKYQAPKEGAPQDHFEPAQEAQQQQQQQQQQPQEGGGAIVIPRVRLTADYEFNKEAAAHHGPMIDGDIAAAPYLRHKEHPDMYDEHQPAEYDADEEDITWLSNINSKNGQNGILAAAIGLYHQVSARISGSSELSGAEPQHAQVQHAQQLPQQLLRLSLDDFERAIDVLELKHFNAVKSWWEEEQAGPSTSAPHVPTIPGMKALLPRAAALEALSGLLPDRKLAAQVLDYWLKRRNQEDGPLLARLWFEQPWKLVAFAHEIVDDDEDFDENLPFMAVEPRSKQKKSRRGGQRRKLNEEDALEVLYGLRNELETVRTLADQVRKREKLKRQLVLLSQQEWQMRRQLARSPAAGRLSGRAPPPAAVAAVTAAAGGAPAGPSAGAGAGPGPGPAAAGAAGGTGLQSPPGSPNTELNKALARVTQAAAAAASPHEGEKARQTRTAAAAAAAEFELAFTAKRRRLLASNPSAAAAAAGPQVALTGALGHKQAAAAAAAAEDATAEVAGTSRLRNQGRQPARTTARAGGRQEAGTSRRGRGPAAAAAAAVAAADELDGDGSSEPSSSVDADAYPSPSDASSDSGDEEYELEEEVSDEGDEQSDGKAAAAEAGQRDRKARGQQGPQVLQQQRVRRQVHQQPARLGSRPGARAAATAARAAAAALMAAEETSAADSQLDSLGGNSSQQGKQQQGQGRARSRVRQSALPPRLQDEQQQQQQQRDDAPSRGTKQRVDRQQGQLLGAVRGSRRNGFVQRPAVLPAVDSSSELQADAISDSDSALQTRKKRRPAAAAGRRVAAAAAAGADEMQPAAPVLRPHNQQPKHLRSHTESQKGSQKLPAAAAAAVAATAAAAAPPAAGAVAASSGAGAAVPVTGGSQSQGGGSVRRSSAGVAAAVHKAEVLRRRQRPAASRRGIGKAELRALGVVADASASQARRKVQ